MAALLENPRSLPARNQAVNSVCANEINTISAILDKFTSSLAHYYKSSKLRNIVRNPENDEAIWIPLKIEGNNESGQSETFNHHEDMLKGLRNNMQNSITLIRGQTGGGKTALLKKICHSWAVKRLTQELTSDDFTVILHVPYTSTDKPQDLLKMAVEHFLKILNLTTFNSIELLNQLEDLGSSLLICLDGRGEYENFGERSLRSLFYQQISNDDPLQSLPYKLLITSSRYGYHKLDFDGLCSQYSICSLDESQLEEFVHEYCETERGKLSAMKHLKNPVVTDKSPLILTLICYLADMNEKIPINQTALYGRCIYHMLRRHEEKLSENVNFYKWKEANVIKSVAELAFNKCEGGNSLIDPRSVPEDAFICGFLLRPEKNCLSVEFPHFSVQEYFAAMYCYHLMLTGNIPKKTRSRENTMLGSSLFFRFLLGIGSTNGDFPKLVDWIQPHIYGSPATTLGLSINYLIQDEVNADCKRAEYCLLLSEFVSTLNYDNRKLEELVHSSELIEISVSKDKADGGDVFYAPPTAPRKAEFGYVSGMPGTQLAQKFDHVTLLCCDVGKTQFAELICRCHLFPSYVDYFNLEIEGQNCFTVALILIIDQEKVKYQQLFTISFPPELISDCLSSIDEKLISDFKLSHSDDSSLSAFVTVTQFVSFPTLFKSVIPLAFKLYSQWASTA